MTKWSTWKTFFFYFTIVQMFCFFLAIMTNRGFDAVMEIGASVFFCGILSIAAGIAELNE